jgi:hypothetical protein
VGGRGDSQEEDTQEGVGQGVAAETRRQGYASSIFTVREQMFLNLRALYFCRLRRKLRETGKHRPINLAD